MMQIYVKWCKKLTDIFSCTHILLAGYSISLCVEFYKNHAEYSETDNGHSVNNKDPV
jgi:hypothetical protein